LTKIVEDSRPGEADIEKEFTSQENKLFVLHDSEGFEPGNEKTFSTVDGFIRRRREASLVKDQLHAVWLCTELPAAGGRAFETGDESLLQLTHQTRTPIVVVFTKSDKVFESKKIELQEDNQDLVGKDLDDRSKEEAKKVHDACVQSLKSIVSGMKPPIPEPRYVKVSGINLSLILYLISVTVDPSPQSVRATKILSSPSLRSLAILSVTSSAWG